MSWQAFTTKWFAIYYVLVGLAMLCNSALLMIKTSAVVQYLLNHSSEKQPPPVIRTLLKYFFFFTLPCLIFSFFPFSWTELLFSLWSLCIIYAAGARLVHWTGTRRLIRLQPRQTQKIIWFAGAAMLAVSLLILILAYLSIQQLAAL